jgi:hypothetical protein
MKMHHVVVAASAALVSIAAVAGGQQHSQSDETRASRAQSQTTPQDVSEATTIRQAQEQLRAAGYAATPQGLREFQEAKGIEPSGQLDQETLAALGVDASAASGESKN